MTRFQIVRTILAVGLFAAATWACLQASVGNPAWSIPLDEPALTVLVPNGGEVWSLGRIHEIRWSGDPSITLVAIEYSTDDGASWTQETAATPNDGSYLWIGPAAATGRCRVRLSDATAPAVQDISDRRFTFTDQDDAFEENDSQAEATELVPGAYSNLRLIKGGDLTLDQDWYKIWVPAGQDLRVDLDGTSLEPGGSADMDFQIRNGEGRVLFGAFSSSAGETGYLAELAAGWYFIFINYGEGNRYTLTVSTGDFNLGSIRGRVTDESGAGIENLWVMFYAPSGAWETALGYVPTDENGDYRFSHLPGEYKIQFDGRQTLLNYIQEWYDGQPSAETAEVIPLLAGQDTTGIDVQLEGGAIISGRVTDGMGSPLSSVKVNLFDADYQSLGGAWTGSDGAYSIVGRPPGDYYIRFRKDGFAFEWYNNRTDRALADPVTVGQGQVVEGIDASLEAPARIRGRVTDGSRQGIANVMVWAYTLSGEQLWAGGTSEEGLYQINNLPAGEVKVQFDASQTIFASEWYQDRSSFEEADPVAVTEGGLVDDFDAVLARRILEVTAPDGGESWLAGTGQVIRWTGTTSIALVRIDYSTDGGDTWIPVAGETPNDGAFEWTVPDTPTDEALVKISDTTNAAVSGVSPAVFAIAPCESPVVPALQAPPVAPSGEMYVLEWDGPNLQNTFEVQESLDLDFAAPTLLFIGGASCTLGKVVAADTVYFYRVRGYLTCHGSRHYSAWSNVRHVVVSPDGTDPYDLDGDGTVDLADYLLLAGCLADSARLLPGQGDLSGDAAMDVLDLVYLRGYLEGLFKR